MTLPVQITLSSTPDTASIATLVRAAFSEYEGSLVPPSGALAETPESIASMVAAGELCWTALCGPTLSGCLLARPEGTTIYLHRLAVLPEGRGIGLASGLLGRAEEHASRHGFSVAALDVRCTLQRNQAFFSTRGYRVVEARHHPGWAIPTFFRMAKQLDG